MHHALYSYLKEEEETETVISNNSGGKEYLLELLSIIRSTITYMDGEITWNDRENIC